MRRSTLPPSPSLVIAALVTALTLAAGCEDSTAPVASRRPVGAVATASPVPTVVVIPGDLHGWSFVLPATGLPCDTISCRLVTGPGTPPLGSGSAALSPPPAITAALTTRQWAGTRLADITSLAWSTWVEGETTQNDAAVTLQLSIEFDLDDKLTSDVAQLTHVPDHDVTAGVWQRLDGRAGRWWSDRQAPQAVHGLGAHPCVRARPCTWAELLLRHPGMGLHREHGDLRFVVAAGVRANIDDVAIGVRGEEQRFDFEREAPSVAESLTRSIGPGVVVDRLPADTLFRAGTRVPYAFTAGPGRAAPVVMLDDTLVTASGYIIMNAAHSLTAVSDTIYSLAGLTPLERRAASLTRALLDDGDRMRAAMALTDFLVAELVAGTEPATLARAVDLADYVMVDPARDSAAIRAMDESLQGRRIEFYAGGEPGSFSAWDPGIAASVNATAAVRSRTGAAPLAPGTVRSDVAVAADPENPREATKVIYTNGILTYRGTAFSSAALLARLLFSQPRFRNHYTSVIFYYNPTAVTQMADYDRAHPCLARYQQSMDWVSPLGNAVRYATCRGVRFGHAVLSADLVESARARAELAHRLQPTTQMVGGLAQLVASLRAHSNDSHVLLVGHSEGTILQEQVVRALPAIEHHPLNVANRCLAVLALAPATSRVDYGLDEFHVKGLLAREDIIRTTLPMGWEDIDSPLSQVARDSIVDSGFDPELTVRVATRVHSVTATYLTGPVASAALDRLIALHRECIPASADLQLSASVVLIDERVSATLAIRNQNERVLLGREVQFGGAGYFFDRVDSVTFRAMAPYDGQLRIGAYVSPSLSVNAPVRIPLLRPDFVIRETPLSEWVVVAAANGPNGGYSEVGAPSGSWDGSESNCFRHERYYGPAGNWQEYELRCNRLYTPVFTRPDTLPTGRRLVGARVHYSGVDGANVLGPTTSYYCAGAAPCITSGYLEWLGELGVVARSLSVTPASSTPGTTTSSP